MDDFMSDEENENVSDIDPEELQKMLAVNKNQIIQTLRSRGVNHIANEIRIR